MKTPEELKKKFIEKYQPEKGHLNMARNFWNGELDELLESHAKEHAKEILNELLSIKNYMEEKNAYHGYGQMNDLITNLEDWILEHGKYPNQ